MHIPYSATVFLALLSYSAPVIAATDDKNAKSKPAPCTIHSPNTGSYFDLTPISLQPLKPGAKPHKDDRTESWHAKGYDYPSNFTLNICAPVLEDVKDVVEVDKALWKNVSAYYESNGKIYSIGWVFHLRMESMIADIPQATIVRATIPRQETGPQLHRWLTVYYVQSRLEVV